MVNRFGCCPNCKTDWNGGDVRNHLATMDVNQYRSSKEIDALAAQFGWTASNPTNFSKAKIIEVTIPTQVKKEAYYECPECHYVYEADTGKEFRNLSEVREAIAEEIVDEIDEELLKKPLS